MSLIQLLEFDQKGDERGTLVALESLKNIPFAIQRVYYLVSLDAKQPRGFHAHKQLKQVAICLSGSCTFVMDDGHDKEDIILQSPAVGLYIAEMMWHEMSNFSKDCVLMVLASDYYDESDYIRCYHEFKKRAAL
ncbi:MAG: FdtA/QdtA family cupin domain-containing protein [bacterium]|nr:FdtA/QdtA family cupin domain-containing protein [bacterium]